MAFLIVVLSSAAVDSGWVKKELRTALHRAISSGRVAVIPILRETCEKPPLLLDLKHLDMRADYDYPAGLKKLVGKLTHGHVVKGAPSIQPIPADPEALKVAEAAFRRRVRERFAEDAPYYIVLAGETIQTPDPPKDPRAPRSACRRRQRVTAEYCEWIPDGRDIVRVKLDSLREAADKYSCVILVGEPGCGKSTALKHLAYELADESGPLPLALHLGAFAPGMTLEDFIVAGWSGPEDAGHWQAPELAANLTGYLQRGRLFCLFDALNEMPHTGYADRFQALRHFINSWAPKGNRFMVSCRVLDYGEELSGLQRVEVQPLRDAQVVEFAKRELPDTWKAFLQELKKEGDGERSLFKLARNPYMLTVMIDVFAQDGRLGETRAALMTRFTVILMGWCKQKCPADEWLDPDVQRAALSVMAFEVQDRAGFGTLIATAQARAVMPEKVQPDPKWPQRPSPPEQLLKLAASANIIEMTGDRSALRFYHQLLQEYFAAREMLGRSLEKMAHRWRWPWLEKEMPKWVRPEDNFDPLPPPPPTKWEETTIMAAGLMPENDDGLVRAVAEINPVLAGRCLYEGRAEVRGDTRRGVIARLLAAVSDPLVTLRVRIAAGEALGNLDDPRPGELVTIPKGKFLMGDDKDENANPQHPVILPEYQIGKYPVTNAEFREFVAADGYREKRWWTVAGWRRKKEEKWTEPRYWEDTRFNTPNQPVVGVSWYEALAYCRWRGARENLPCRLPTEAQWEKAARGTDGRKYPWGKAFDPTLLNSSEGDQTVESTTPVGVYPAGVSPNHCWDMAGNVWEWTSTEYREYKYSPKDGREDLDAGDDVPRVLRGDSWGDYRDYARCTFRFCDDPNYSSGDHGFRVVVYRIL
jgi:formylglycine-generating enzyme required for sulfatase activity/energy-coupling factor transporter ATP-binding protein EcfA2